jgi:hypothetical protein
LTLLTPSYVHMSSACEWEISDSVIGAETHSSICECGSSRSMFAVESPSVRPGAPEFMLFVPAAQVWATEFRSQIL